ncbi:MAG: enoyl-CoA hydratase/isomerase family protein [Gammaproteobacteria bacterium]|nr:MAG: enoyl-CoA hydratase/isomerase family protein [Gammaproteobacteria bacterium]UTW42649.1 enoyl-CoA hydratase/isomerase family protein [bacterium SCSIO 12844]
MDIMPVILTSDNGCYRLKLNRIEAHNALNPQMLDGIYQHLLTVQEDNTAKVLIIESNSEHFMVGGDIYYFGKLIIEAPEMRCQIIKPMLDQAQLIIEMIASLSIPVVAVTRGIVAGYGLSLILACDYVLALDNSNFHSSYIGIGLTADGGQLWSLKQALGLKYAKRMLLFNEQLNATDAQAIGLVDCLCQSTEALDIELNKLIKKMFMMPAHAFSALKKHLNQIDALSETLEAEKALFLTQIASDEFTARISAFIEAKKHKKVTT